MPGSFADSAAALFSGGIGVPGCSAGFSCGVVGLGLCGCAGGSCGALVSVLAGCCAKNKEDAINTNAQKIFIFEIMPLTRNLFFDFKHGADFTPIPSSYPASRL